MISDYFVVVIKTLISGFMFIYEGDGDNVVKHIDPSVVSKSPKDLEKLFNRQSLSFFVKRERSRGAWASS